MLLTTLASLHSCGFTTSHLPATLEVRRLGMHVSCNYLQQFCIPRVVLPHLSTKMGQYCKQQVSLLVYVFLTGVGV